jgi:hypothetical protein
MQLDVARHILFTVSEQCWDAVRVCSIDVDRVTFSKEYTINIRLARMTSFESFRWLVREESNAQRGVSGFVRHFHGTTQVLDLPAAITGKHEEC